MSEESKVVTLASCRACRTGSGAVKHFPSSLHAGTYIIYCTKCGAATEPHNSAEEAAETWNYRPNAKKS